MDDTKIYVRTKAFVSEIAARKPGQWFSFILAFLSLGLYVQIAFFTKRTDTSLLLSMYAILFLSYVLLFRSVLAFKFLIGFGILFRLIFLFSVPNLSDDFFRFFWDGTLINNHINPFLYLPREIMENSVINITGLDVRLFSSLNSPDYYTIYPPVCQFVFWVSAKLSGENIHIALLIMKVFLLLSELGTIFLILKLLKIRRLKREYVYYYILNPLVIIELMGNIHFDAFLIFFVLLSIYLLEKNKLFAAATAFSLAVAAKLTPLLFLPFFLKPLKIKRAVLFYTLTLALTVLSFWPFFGLALFKGMSSSIGLYFQKFEFNASIFYLVREVGFWVKGWNIIQTAGVWMAAVTLLGIVSLALFTNQKKQNLPGVLFWPLFIYFSFASIIHPWYVTPLVAFSIFSKYRFPLVWSFTVFFSYAGYSSNGFRENYWVLLLEYIPVFIVMIYELRKHKDLISIKNPFKEKFGR